VCFLQGACPHLSRFASYELGDVSGTNLLASLISGDACID